MAFELKKETNTILLWRGHHVMTSYNHLIIRIPTAVFSLNSKFSIEPINYSNISEIDGGDFSIIELKKEMSKNRERIEGFICRDTSGMRLGYLWIMYKGGNEFQYRVRNTEAFFFDCYVFPEARRRGIANALFKYCLTHLNEKGIDYATLACRKNNQPALNLYINKLDGVVIGRKRWIRIWRIKIPYHKV